MSISAAATLRTFAMCVLCFCLSSIASAQNAAPAASASTNPSAQTSDSTAPKSELEEVRLLLLKQQEELARMRATINEQSRQIDALRQRVDQVSAPGAQPALITTSQVITSDSMGSVQQTS